MDFYSFIFARNKIVMKNEKKFIIARSEPVLFIGLFE